MKKLILILATALGLAGAAHAASGGGIAWEAHVGGFIAGAGLTFAIRRRLWLRLEPESAILPER